MADDTEKNATSDLLGAVRAETLHEETKGTDAPSTDAEIDDAVEAEVNKPTPRLNPRA
jgi:hypothetical protein